MFEYEYPRPALTVDIIIERTDIKSNEYLFIKRKPEAFEGNKLAFPGGFVDSTETVEQAACRELREETNLFLPQYRLNLFKIASKPGRDKRGWIISIVYYAIVHKKDTCDMKAGDDAGSLIWIPKYEIDGNKDLFAFDHYEIIQSLTR